MSILSYIQQTFAEPLPCGDKIGSNTDTVPAFLVRERHTSDYTTTVLGNNWAEGHSKLHSESSRNYGMISEEIR